jgi:phospholipid-binding lipoprotein MlaA
MKNINHVILPKSLLLFAAIGSIALVGRAAEEAVESPQAEIPAKRQVSEFVHEDVEYAIDVYDPWESFNRRVYAFNYKFDKYVFLPVVKTYETILPKPAEKGVSNFFGNLGEVETFANSLLQGKGGKAGTTLKRFTVNSTVGLLGLFDVATKMDIQKEKEDVGQTLAVWGVGSGRYIVLPFLGPSNVRDASGTGITAVANHFIYSGLISTMGLKDVQEDDVLMGLNATRTIDTRHRTKFRYYKSGSPFEYDMIRLLYMEGRMIQVEN